tara:strand:- start:117 stop:644 length:528 start_codon:yes stop_codon:yes gene_type:complete
MRIKEFHEIIIDHHPFSDILNKQILEDINQFKYHSYEETSYYTNIHANQVTIPPEKRTESLNNVLKWVDQVLQCNEWYIKTYEHDGEISISLWAARYNKGEYTVSHHHFPYSIFAFVYFVKSPPGSSPLVFSRSGKRIKPEEGKLVIFPGNVMHHVPKNNSDDRVTLAGNIGVSL